MSVVILLTYISFVIYDDELQEIISDNKGNMYANRVGGETGDRGAATGSPETGPGGATGSPGRG